MRTQEVSHLAAAAALPSFLVLSLLLVPSCDSSVSTKVLPPASLRAFEVESIFPIAGADNVSPDVVVEVLFSKPLDRRNLGGDLSLLDDFIRLVESASETAVSGEYELDTFDRRVVFTPDSPLKTPAVSYELLISGDLLDADGQTLDLADTTTPIVFTTIADTEPPQFAGIQSLVPVCSALLASWDAAADDFTPEEDILYRVFVDPKPSSITDEFIEIQGQLETFLTGLVLDTVYTVRVTAVDTAGNESVTADSLSARSDLADSEAPNFDGGVDMVPDPSNESATALQVTWNRAEDNCDSESVRYRIYLLRCGASSPDCERTITAEDCLDSVSSCRVPDSECLTVEDICAFSPEECAALEGACLTDAESVIGNPSLIVTSEPGVTEITIDGVDADSRYAAVVRAVDTSDNEDGNTRVLETFTRTGFRENVTPVITRNGCVAAGCHNAESRSGDLVLESYESLVVEGGFTQDPPTVNPGNAAESTLILRIATTDDFLRMPPCFGSRLPMCPKEIEVVRRWIDQGALDN